MVNEVKWEGIASKMNKNEYHLRKSKNTNEELNDIYHLWQECFGDSDSYMDFYFRHVIPKNRVISLYDENEIVSMLHLNPYELIVLGKKVTANYIVGVATKPSYRKRGLMRNLMEESFRQMYKNKESFTYLMPIAKEIYEPFDFSIVYEQEPWNYRMLRVPCELVGNEKDHNDIIDIELINGEMANENKSVYDKDSLVTFANEELSKKYNVYVPRNKEYFDILLDEVTCCGGGFLIFKQEDDILGYIAYMFDDMFHIVELICKDEYQEKLVGEAYKIYCHVNKEKSDNINRFQTTIMMRIIHFEEFIKNVRSNEKVSFVMEVEDEILTENKGIYLLEIDEDKGSVKRINEEPQVRVNVKQLVDLFFDRMSKEDMYSIVVSEDKKEILEKLNKIIKYNKVFINDVV